MSRVTKKIQERVSVTYSLKAMRAYLMERNKWDEETLDMVNWSGMKAALAPDSHNFWVRVVKFQCEWLNIGVQQHKIDSVVTNECPCCGHPRERGICLMMCPAVEM